MLIYLIIFHIDLNKIQNKWYAKEELTFLEKTLLMLVTTKREELSEISEGEKN